MQLNIKHTTFLLSLCAVLAACSDHDVLVANPDSSKPPIELSVGGVDAPGATATRAVITDGSGKTLRAFTGKTRLFFAMVAEDGSGNKKYGFNYGTAAAVTSPAVNSKSTITFPDNYLYWDDAYARDSKVSVYSIAVANKERGNVALTPNGSIVIGTESPGKAIIPFTTTSPGEPTFKWQIANPQNQEVFEWADLVFSNNIANYDTDPANPAPAKDKRLKFHKDPNDGDMYHKFDQGELIYYHALTQFTIKIKCGDGFKGNGDDFKFTNAAGVACTTPNNSFGLNGFYGADGVFRIGNGEFDAMANSNLRNYTSIYKVSETHQKASAGEYYLMKAYVFPGTDMTGTKDDAFTFVIDGNKYDISLAMLYDAIKLGQTNVDKQGASPSKVDASILDEITIGEGGKKLKAGYNYEFTFTVEKSKIKNITAQVVDWETVDAQEEFPSNARITLNVEDRSTNTSPVTDNMDIYRALDEASTVTDTYEGYNWTTKYTVDGKAKWNGTTLTYNSDRWSTDWFWESNKTYYHFRTLSPTTQVVTQNASGDYTTIQSASCTNEASYNQMAWGAPFLDVADSYKFTYSPEKGFDGTGSGHQIYKAIGPTKDQIKVLMFHMFSGIHFTIKTSNDADKVQLCQSYVENEETKYKHTKVNLVGYYPKGKILLGTGLVNTDGTITDEDSPYGIDCATTATDEYGNQDYFFSAVPQYLTDVKLYITTPDNNKYIVDLKDVIAATSSISSKNMTFNYPSAGTGKVKITDWVPNTQYHYTFTLKKTGITNLQATIVDWETVEAGDDNVQIQ